MELWADHGSPFWNTSRWNIVNHQREPSTFRIGWFSEMIWPKNFYSTKKKLAFVKKKHANLEYVYRIIYIYIQSQRYIKRIDVFLPKAPKGTLKQKAVNSPLQKSKLLGLQTKISRNDSMCLGGHNIPELFSSQSLSPFTPSKFWILKTTDTPHFLQSILKIVVV